MPWHAHRSTLLPPRPGHPSGHARRL